MEEGKEVFRLGQFDIWTDIENYRRNSFSDSCPKVVTIDQFEGSVEIHQAGRKEVSERKGYYRYGESMNEGMEGWKTMEQMKNLSD